MKAQIVIPLFLLTVATSAAGADEQFVAKVGETTITRADFDRYISYQGAEEQAKLKSDAKYRKQMVDRIVNALVVSRIAHKAGFDQRRDVREKLALLANDFITLEYLENEVAAKATVTDGEMKSYYDGHHQEFTLPDAVRVRHILVKVDQNSDEKTKKAARERAEKILARAKGGADFAALAKETSDDKESRERGGDLGFVSRGLRLADLEKEIFSLKPGEVGKVVSTPYGFHVVKVEERRSAALQPYDQVKEKLRTKLAKEAGRRAIKEFVASSVKASGAKVNGDALAAPPGR